MVMEVETEVAQKEVTPMETGSRRAREKIKREAEMIEKAEELFCKNGFEKTTMEDLSKQAEFTKRTIYKYFTCKEDLFFAVSRSNYEQLWAAVRLEMAGGRDGFDRIQRACKALYSFYEAHPDKLTLICLTDLVKSREDGIRLPNRSRFYELNQKILEELTEVFREGAADGSIRGDLETSQLVMTAIFAAVGFFRMEVCSGNLLDQALCVDRRQFSRQAVELLTGIFRPA